MDRWLVLLATIVGIVGTMVVFVRVLVALFAWRNNIRRRLCAPVSRASDTACLITLTDAGARSTAHTMRLNRPGAP